MVRYFIRAIYGIAFLFLMFVFNSCLFAAKIVPHIHYEYTAGSDDYHSNEGSGGILILFPKRLRFLAAYSYITDRDYEWIQSGSGRLKKGIRSDLDLSAGIILSGGKFKGLNGNSSLTSANLEIKKYFKNRFESAFGYRYTHGSIFLRINSEVAIIRKTTVETEIIEEELSASYSAHTITSSWGYGWTKQLEGLWNSLRFSLTTYSSRSPSFSEELETSYLLPYFFTAGISYTLIQPTWNNNQYYISLFLSKSF